MNVSVLVLAVLEYLKDHRPTTPQESNFQAELKAASHWYWFEQNERMQFVSRHFDDMQLKKIAKLALERWTKKLIEKESQAQTLLSAKQGDSDDSDSSGSIEDEISGDCKLLWVVKLLISCIIIWLVFVADIMRSYWIITGNYSPVMPTGRLRIMQIRKSPVLKIQAH